MANLTDCRSSPLVTANPQSRSHITSPEGVDPMAPDKRSTFVETSNAAATPHGKQRAASIAIQLPSTSASLASANHPINARIADPNNNNTADVTDHTDNSSALASYCQARHSHHGRAYSQHTYTHLAAEPRRGPHQELPVACIQHGASRHHHPYRHNSSERSLLPDSGISSTTDSDESPTPPPHYHEIPGIVPSYQGRTSGPPPSYDDVVNPNAPPPSYQALFGQVREARKTSNGLVDLFRQLFLILIGTLGCTMIIGFLLLIPITMILVGIVYVNECRAENIPSFLVIGGFVWIVKNVLNCYNQFKKDSSTVNRPPPRRTPLSPAAADRQHHNNPTIAPTEINTLVTPPPTVNTASDASVVSIQNVLTVPEAPYLIPDVSTTISSSTLAASATSTLISQNNTTSSLNTATSTTRTTRSLNSREQYGHANRIREPSLIGITSFKCESMLNYFLIVWFLAGCIVVYRIYEPDYDNPLSNSYCNRTVYLYAFWLMTSTFIFMAVILSCLCCLMASSMMSCNHGR